MIKLGIDNYLGNFIIVDSNNEKKIHQKTWEEIKNVLIPCNKFSNSYEIFNEIHWNLETLKKNQTKYMNFFGNLYHIEELLAYEFTSNNLEYNGQNLTMRSNIISNLDHLTINSVAKEISEYLENIKTMATDKGIREALRHIFDEEFINNDSAIELLLRMQKAHQIYPKRRKETFKKWILQTSSNLNKGCEYGQIFLLNTDYQPNILK